MASFFEKDAGRLGRLTTVFGLFSGGFLSTKQSSHFDRILFGVWGFVNFVLGFFLKMYGHEQQHNMLHSVPSDEVRNFYLGFVFCFFFQ